MTKKAAQQSAETFEVNYRIHHQAVANAESRVKNAIALEESSKEELKCYAQQNDATLFPEGTSTAKIHGDVVLTRRSGATTYNLSLIAQADREYLMAHYPNAFSSVKTRFIDGDDDRAQNLLRKCATQGDPTYIVTLASNSKALKSK